MDCFYCKFSISDCVVSKGMRVVGPNAVILVTDAPVLDIALASNVGVLKPIARVLRGARPIVDVDNLVGANLIGHLQECLDRTHSGLIEADIHICTPVEVVGDSSARISQ